jgi:hypothetical protein
VLRLQQLEKVYAREIAQVEAGLIAGRGRSRMDFVVRDEPAGRPQELRDAID